MAFLSIWLFACLFAVVLLGVVVVVVIWLNCLVKGWFLNLSIDFYKQLFEIKFSRQTIPLEAGRP